MNLFNIILHVAELCNAAFSFISCVQSDQLNLRRGCYIADITAWPNALYQLSTMLLAPLQNNGETEATELPPKPVIKKKRLIWDIQIDPDDADMAGASEEAIKMMTQSRRVTLLPPQVVYCL